MQQRWCDYIPGSPFALLWLLEETIFQSPEAYLKADTLQLGVLPLLYCVAGLQLAPHCQFSCCGLLCTLWEMVV